MTDLKPKKEIDPTFFEHDLNLVVCDLKYALIGLGGGEAGKQKRLSEW